MTRLPLAALAAILATPALACGIHYDVDVCVYESAGASDADPTHQVDGDQVFGISANPAYGPGLPEYCRVIACNGDGTPFVYDPHSNGPDTVYTDEPSVPGDRQ